MEFGKFHYAIQVADLVSDLSQTGSSYLDMPVQAIFHYAVLLASRSATREPARELVADLLVSWSQAG